MKKSAKIFVSGIVQGIGFRPFIHRLATKHNLCGNVFNTSKGVKIEVEGEDEKIKNFYNEIKNNSPTLSKIDEIKIKFQKIKNFKKFSVIKSKKDKEEFVLISPDICICSDCLEELFNEKDRRYQYPFINCTNCGPRFTIIENIPYDRKSTTMKKFKMCKDCEREYKNIKNRRYHAEPNACFICGPEVSLVKIENNKIEKLKCESPIYEAVKLLKRGKILGIKGLGGFHLACDATNEKVVIELKRRKKRERDKPLAVMMKDLNAVRNYCKITSDEEKLLASKERPIVLLEKLKNCKVAFSVAPRNKYLGVMLPYTPLHYLLLDDISLPLVMTSGNTSEEPIVKDNEESYDLLSSICDYFLIHNRDIFSRCDDSVTRIINGKESIIRRSRGYVPYPLKFDFKFKEILACGAELKNTFCLTKNNYAIISQHLGDLKNYDTFLYYEKAIEQFKKFFRINPKIVVCDLHPDYLSTKYAQSLKNVKLVSVQHHCAHIASCLAENNIFEKVIGVSFDGTGYGDDGKIWGGEFFVCDFKNYKRIAHLNYIPLPGGDKVVKEVWRITVSYLYQIFGEKTLDLKLSFFKKIDKEKIKNVFRMIDKDINCPLTSSCGRLFDAVSSLIGLCYETNYEGQAAVELEMAIVKNDKYKNAKYSYKIFEKDNGLIIDVLPMINEIVIDLKNNKSLGVISYKFHNTVVDFILNICLRAKEKFGINKVALSGGCFQNKFLSEKTCNVLTKNNFIVYTHSKVPANDGGICLGQAMIANWR